MRTPSFKQLTRVLLVLTFFLAFTGTAVSWWNDDWEYRHSFNVTEQSGNSLSNHQVKFSIDTETLISEGKMQDDCSDMRWTDGQENLLDHWVRTGCKTASTEVLVELDSLSASSEKTIYMYYGDSTVSSISSPEATMYIYDLHGNGYDGSLYGSANYHSGSEFVELTDAANDQQGSIRYSQGTPSPGFYAEWEWYTGDGSGADSNNLVAWNNGNRFEREDPAGNGVHYILNDHDDCNGVAWSTQCGDIESWSEDPAKSEWKQAEAYGVRNDDTLDYYFNTIGNTVQGSWTNSNFPPGDQFGWSGRTGGLNNHHWVRKMTVRKYTDPAPQVEEGTEEKFNLCDRRGPENECIMDSERSYSGKNFLVDNVFIATQDAVFSSLSEQTDVKVSNSSVISGLWEGNLNISARELQIKPSAKFRPEDRIVIDER
jgi:hypothetical protein